MVVLCLALEIEESAVPASIKIMLYQVILGCR